MSSRRRNLIAVVVTVAALAATPVALAGALSSPSVEIGANQSFVAQVNGRSAATAIRVACPGPITPARTGHPLAGQSLGVLPIGVFAGLPAGVGYTGSAAKAIVATIGAPFAASGSVIFTSYGVKPLPTSANVPCSGSGVVTFTPVPASPTARSATVAVSFVNLALTPARR